MADLNKYFELMKEYPHHFINNNGLLTIITDRNVIEDYMSKNHVSVGVIYESRYHTLVVDLVKDNQDHYFLYDRIICEEHAVVMITTYQNKYVLLKQYRHSLRDNQYAFPRGFGEKGLSGMKNAAKEIKEELNGTIKSIQELGQVVANSGIAGNKVDVYYVELESLDVQKGYEGIEEVMFLSKEELRQMIQSNQINDAMSLSALMLYWNK